MIITGGQVWGTIKIVPAVPIPEIVTLITLVNTLHGAMPIIDVKLNNAVMTIRFQNGNVMKQKFNSRTLDGPVTYNIPNGDIWVLTNMKLFVSPVLDILTHFYVTLLVDDIVIEP